MPEAGLSLRLVYSIVVLFTFQMKEAHQPKFAS